MNGRGAELDGLWRRIEDMIVRTFLAVAHSRESEPSGYCHNKLYGLDVMLDSAVPHVYAHVHTHVRAHVLYTSRFAYVGARVCTQGLDAMG